MSTEANVMTLFRLDGRVALLTGACGWLGSAMSRALAEAGARVVVTSRDAARAAEFAASLPGSGHLGLGFDQGDTDSIPAFVEQVVAEAGQLDILVNNAYGGRVCNIDSATAEEFDQAYHVGVTAYFMLAREVAGHLRRRGCRHGSIVNIGSMYGVVASYPDAYEGQAYNSPPNYHALKGGIVHLTRHLAAYWATDGIRVNCLSPGAFPKDSVGEQMPEFVARLEAKVPLGRMGRPEELKGMIVLLAGDAGSYITGQNYLIDGGWTAW